METFSFMSIKLGKHEKVVFYLALHVQNCSKGKQHAFFATKNTKKCCGAGAGGAEIILDLEPEPKLNF